MSWLLWNTVNDGTPRGSAVPITSIGAYLQSRAAIAIVGATYLGWAPPECQVLITGTRRDVTDVGRDGWEIEHKSEGQPSIATFVVNGFEPPLWSEVRITRTPPNQYLFVGTIIRRELRAPIGPDPDGLQWVCTAAGPHWLLNRGLVTKYYDNVGVNTMVANILAECTFGEFHLGYIEPGLGNLTMDFPFPTTVVAALLRIAKATGTFLKVSPTNHVSLFYTEPIELPDIDDDAEVYMTGYRDDGSQFRSKVQSKGQGVNVTAVTAAGSSTIHVADTAPFTGGTRAIVKHSILTYAATSVPAGPGSLTGVTGLVEDLAINETVHLLIEETDSAAVTALAAALGGGKSGLITHGIVDDEASRAEATARVSAELDVFAGALPDLTYTRFEDNLSDVGRTVTWNRTTPVAIAGEFLIQNVRITPLEALSFGHVPLRKDITASYFVRAFVTLLKDN